MHLWCAEMYANKLLNTLSLSSVIIADKYNVSAKSEWYYYVCVARSR